MFTGLVSDVGEIAAVSGAEGGMRRLTVFTAYDVDAIPIGASVCCAGACLTVIAKGHKAGRAWFEVEASAETLRATTLGEWQAGRAINLERPLKLGDEFGGHIVAGHVDGVGTVAGAEPEAGSVRLSIDMPPHLARYVAAKGSIALDGVSMTVNTVEGARFSVNVIPHTRAVTTLGGLKPGDRVNVEVDVLARYIERLTGR